MPQCYVNHVIVMHLPFVRYPLGYFNASTHLNAAQAKDKIRKAINVHQAVPQYAAEVYYP